MKTATGINWEDITRDDFEAYEAVRASGVTNMFAVTMVKELSGLDREVIRGIMRHYSDLATKYPGVRS